MASCLVARLWVWRQEGILRAMVGKCGLESCGGQCNVRGVFAEKNLLRELLAEPKR